MNSDVNLENLYVFRKENERYIQEVSNYIKENNVVPFIGSGMSIGIYPTLQQFFEDILKSKDIRISHKVAIKQFLEKKDYENAASTYYKAVGQGLFIDQIKTVYSEERVTKEKYSNLPVYLLPSIFKNSTMITTNFDRLLETVYHDEAYPFKGYLTPYEDSKVVLGEFHLGMVHYLLKLHGDYMSTDTIVFTEEQYNKCYGESLDSKYVDFLMDTLSSRILLFLGCSLDVDRILKLLEKIACTKNRTHYAILDTPNDNFDDEYYDRRFALSELGIKVIWYPKGKHEYVSLILKEIQRLLLLKEEYSNVHVITNTLVQKPSSDFLGRDSEIKTIQYGLKNETKLVLVNGIGGIGKTQICSHMYYQYLHKPNSEISHLGWITFDGDLIKSIFNRIRDIHGIDNSSDYFGKSIEYLNDLGNKLLLFIDNANTLSIEEQKLISELTCRVIVTSRSKNFNHSFRKIEIERLSEDDCLILYKRTAYGDEQKELSIEELNAVKELIRRAERHSITLVLLAKTQNATHSSANHLLEQVIDSDFNLSANKEPIRYENEETIFIEHLRKLFQVAELRPEECKLLKWFSLMANLALPYDKVKQWFELDSFEQVNHLINRGWLMDLTGETVLVHPIIAAVVKVEYGIDVVECERVIENIANDMIYTPYDNYTDKWKYFSFASAVAKNFEKNFYENEILSHMYLWIGNFYQSQGHFQNALKYYEKSLHIREIVLGREHPDTAMTYNNMALVFDVQGDYQKALTYCEQALHISEKILGREHPDTAMIYSNMASVFLMQKNYEQALKYSEKALHINEKVLEKDHPHNAKTYNLIAIVFRDQGDYEQALTYYAKALHICEKVLGNEHPDTSMIYFNIAEVFLVQEVYEPALTYYEIALRISEKVLGKEHPYTTNIYRHIANVFHAQGDYEQALMYYEMLHQGDKILGTDPLSKATAYNNLAAVFHTHGVYEQALTYCEKALNIYEIACEKEHLSKATTYCIMADVYYAQGAYEKALTYLEKVLHINENVLGKEHPDTATTYNHIATVFHAQGAYEQALMYYEKGLNIREKCLGIEHSSTATTYHNMAGVYHDQGVYIKALTYYKKALDISEKVLGREHPDTAMTYNRIAGLLLDLGNSEQALMYYEKALDINEKVLGREHPNTAMIYNNMAEVFYTQRAYEKALKYYEKSLCISEKILGKAHLDTNKIYSSMALVYTAQGVYEKALKYYEKALVIFEKVLGRNHPDTAKIYNNIALVFHNQEVYELALTYYEKALHIRETVLGREHPDTAVTYDNMAGVFAGQKFYEKALKYYEKSLHIFEKVLGKMHPDTALTYYNMASMFHDQRFYEKALKYYEKVLHIRKTVLGREHPDTAKIYNNMAKIYKEQESYEQAIKYYEKALHIFEKVLGREHPYTVTTYHNIKSLKNSNLI